MDSYAGMIRVAHYYGGMTPEECAKRISYPWYLATIEHMNREWEVPSRTDHYIMANSAEVRRGWVHQDQRKDVKNEDFRLTFSTSAEVEEDEDSEEAFWRRVEHSKAAWLGAAARTSPTGQVNIRTIPKSEAEPWNPPVWTEKGYM